MTQQEFLNRAYDIIRRDILPDAPPREDVVLTYGFPSRGARARTRMTLGECHYDAETHESGIEGYKAAIFIHPRQWGASEDVMHVLVHEMIHAAAPGAGHKGEFVKLAKAVGLEGKPTATVAGDKLLKQLAGMQNEIGEFPAARLAPVAYEKKGSRLRLWECKCGVKVRVARDDFNATCDDCNTKFEFIPPEE